MTPMPASTVISAAGAGTAHEIASNPNTPATPARFNQLLMVLPPIISLADFIAAFVARMERSVIRERLAKFRSAMPRISFAPSGATASGSVSHRLIDFVRRARRDRVSVHHE